MRKGHIRQQGATLVISLIMLVVLTMFAISGFNLSSVNLKIAGNFQNQKNMEAIAQQAIEVVMSDPNSFAVGVPSKSCGTPTIGPLLCESGYTVTVSAPKCIYNAPAEGYSLKEGSIVPDDNDWDINATVTDTVGGAKATIYQGVRMRMLAGNCV